MSLAADRAQDHFRSADLHLVALAAHLLDEDRQLELASAQDLEGVGRVRRHELDGDVAEDFLLEPGPDVATRDIAALAPGERRGVCPEGHAQRRGVQIQALHRPRICGVRDGIADRHVWDPGQGHDVAREGFVNVDALDAVGGGEARHGSAQDDGAARDDRAVRVLLLLAHDDDPAAHLDRAVPDTADGHSADVVVGRQVGNQQLERMVRHVSRRRSVLDQQFEERPKVGPGVSQIHRRGPGLGVGVHHREVDLMLIRAEVHEQLVDGVEDLRRPRIGAIDLVDRDDDRQVVRHGLLENVARLRQRALRRVHEQQHRVDHVQAALDLTAEVGMAGRVDDVQAYAVVVDRGLLGEDRDPLLPLQVIRVHDPIDDDLVGPEGTGLAQHRVDERGLAVIDVGDDGDIADVGPDRGRGVDGAHLTGVLEFEGRGGTG